MLDSEVVVGFHPEGEILHVASRPIEWSPSWPAAALDGQEAIRRAADHIGARLHEMTGSPRRVIAPGDKAHPGLHAAWEVPAWIEDPPGDWLVYVDAGAGEVVRSVDMIKRSGGACIACTAGQTGCGRPFFEDPVGLFDNPSLRDINNVDAAQSLCLLANLTSGIRLDGSFANTSITSSRIGPPYTALRSASQPAVDEVTAYHHIDRAKQYLTALGFPGVMSFSISTDAHDSALGDNSHYVPGGDFLEFGVGGVDDAQDPDIVYHEYGHAIQDNQVPNFGTNLEGGSMGEGFGDYWAAALTDDSFTPALGPACVGAWDATAYNPYQGIPDTGCLRRVDGLKVHPRDLSFQVHDDGEIWSSALWGLRAQVGGAVADALVIKSHTFLTPATSFLAGADALLAADAALFGGSHTASIHAAMAARGIPRTQAPASSTGLTGSAAFVCETAHQYANNSYKECLFTQPGAERLRVRFSRLETELDFDPVLVSTPDFRQVQALSGDPFAGAAGFSAAVPGDTILVRFRADGSVRDYGFRIDLVQYALSQGAGAVPDGDLVPGAPLDVTRSPGGDLVLTWSESCAAGDDDYEIYEGSLGDYDSHAPRFCSTGGLTTMTLTPASGSSYYLIVPRNPGSEGSYGRRSDGLQRPASTAACLPQSLAPGC